MQIGFSGLLALLFIGLKLTGFIDWSWVWVLSPIWIGFALIVFVLILMVLTGGTINISHRNNKTK
jgi:hypothetical protein